MLEIPHSYQGRSVDVEDDCRDLMRHLLQNDPRLRLPVKGLDGYVAFQRHAFFANVDWTLMKNRAYFVPFVGPRRKELLE